MTSAVYEVKIDTGRDGTYSAALDDASGYVVSATWNTGMADSYQEVAPPSQLDLTLDNSTGVFSQDDETQPYCGKLPPGTLVRVRMFHDDVWTQLWTGAIAEVSVAPGYLREKTCRLTCQDMMLRLLDAEYTPELQTSVTVDAALEALLESGMVALPYDGSYWVLNAETLGVGTVLHGTALTEFDTGKTTLAWVGDNAGTESGTSAQGFIRHVVPAEAGGRFWWDGRAGKFKFHNRHRDITNETVAAVFEAGELQSADPRFGDDLVNIVTVNYEPRRVGVAASTLYSADDAPFVLRTGQTRVFAVRYRDPDNTATHVGASTVIEMVAGTDMVANTASNGGGTNMTGSVSLSFVGGAAGARITLINNAGSNVYITTLQVRGTPLAVYNRASARAVDALSIVANERRERTLNVPAISDGDFAQEYANWLLAQFRVPVSRFASITVLANSSAAMMTHAVSRTVGDLITVRDSFTGHDRDYIIVGEGHQVAAGGEHAHEATWVLKPVSTIGFWALGVSGHCTLGSTTALVL